MLRFKETADEKFKSYYPTILPRTIIIVTHTEAEIEPGITVHCVQSTWLTTDAPKHVQIIPAPLPPPSTSCTCLRSKSKPDARTHVQADLIPAPPDAPATYTNYRGYEIDLIKSMARLLNFTYDLTNPEDGSWGHINPETGNWNGLIAKVQEEME